MHLDYAQSIGYEFVSGVAPVGQGGLGASVQYFHPESFTARDQTGAETGQFTSNYTAYSLAYGHALGDSLSLGAAVRVVEARLGDVSAGAVAGDIGGLYRISPRVSVAAAGSNFGTKMRFLSDGESLPDSYRLGVVVSPTRSWTLAAESSYGSADQLAARLGAEWRPMVPIALRAGYHSDGASAVPGLTGLTTGVGLTAFGQRLDYAWAPMGDLGNTQYFSVLLSFGGAKK